MVRRSLLLRSSALAAAVIGLCGLGACNRQSAAQNTTPAGDQTASADALPLTTAEVAPSALAPAADVLPAAAPASVVRVANTDNDYAYLDQAYYEGGAYEDAPPDYAFDYDGATPWAWQGNDGMEFAEPVAGGYRYYYYEPGAAWPYLIRDNGYAYAFDGPQLAMVYDGSGRVMPRSFIDQRAALAGSYLARAHGLLDASRQADRRSVAAANWAAARSQISAQRAQLSAARSRQSAWQSYDQAHAAQQSARWDAERTQRQASAQRFEGWRQANFQGPPPAPAGQGRRDAQVRQAQAAPPFRQEQRAADQAPGQRPVQADVARQQAEQQQRQAQDQQRVAQEQQRQAQAQNHAQDQARNQQAMQQRQQADQQRRLAEGQQHQAQQQAIQQRQAADQHHQAEASRAQAMQQRQQAQQAQQQQRAQADQARQQAQQQRQAAEQPRIQAAQQQRQQAEQAHAQAQQAAQQRQAAQAARPAPAQPRPQPAAHPHPPAPPPAARPAGQNEHREHQ